MSTCNCENEDLNTKAAIEDGVPCPAEVHETVCVQAEVTITPAVDVGSITTTCVGGPVIGACPGTPAQSCTFVVSQNICVDVELDFSADATAVPHGIVCGTPSIGACQ